MTKKLTAAAALAAKGFKVFPIQAGAKFPPLIKDWPTLATTDGAAIKSWWTQWPDANIGIHTAGMLVVDVDPRKGGDESLKQLEAEHGSRILETLTTITPTGGRHLFYTLGEDSGVANSVERLGKGLDVRSANGYVLAPGSTVAAGRYRFTGDAPVAVAPASLVSLSGTAPESRTHTEPVPDAPEDVVERAREYLRGAERSVRGSGGDQAAYRVACQLRDLGISEIQCAELMRSEAWDHGCGWRDGRLEDKPIRSAYRYAQNDPGSAIAAPADFPVIPESGTIVPKSGRIQRLDEYAGNKAQRPGYLIKGLLYRKSYVNLFGAPGGGKTFVALDIAYHVAASSAWMGKKVRGGLVVYLPFEGKGGLVTRAQALRQRYGTEDTPFYIADAVFNLRQKEGRQAFGGLLAELPTPPALIVIDTFAHALMGGDENSAQDVGAFNSAVMALIQSTGACVMIVHHTGKNKAAGARGSSALQGALDAELYVDGGAVTATKQRDVELGEPIGFRLKTVVVGLDEDNEEVTSCVVEPDKAQRKPGGRIAGNQKRAWDVLCEARPNNDPITEAEWKEKCSEFLPARKASFYDIKNGLLRKGYINVSEAGMVTRRCE